MLLNAPILPLLLPYLLSLLLLLFFYFRGKGAKEEKQSREKIKEKIGGYVRDINIQVIS